jgi:hypothetical protein
MARSMLSNAQLPRKFWGEAVKTACHVKNMVPHRKLTKKELSVTPFELWEDC